MQVQEGVNVNRYLSTREMKRYERLCRLDDAGILITPERLEFICRSNDYDAQRIGELMLEVLPKALTELNKGVIV